MLQFLQYFSLMNLEFLIYSGALINMLFSSRYIYLIFQGKVQPNRVTWFVWGLAPIIGFFAMIADGFHISALPVFIAGFIPFLIFLASFCTKKAYWKLKKFDYLCGGLSLIALLLWGITNEPILAVVFTIISDAFALFPTLKKAWLFPETEDSIGYFGGLFGSVMGFFAIEGGYTFFNSAFLIYIAIACASVIFAVERKRFFRN